MTRYPPKRKKKPSLFNALKRIGRLETVVVAMLDQQESAVVRFICIVGAFWGIGAFLVVVGFMLLNG